MNLINSKKKVNLTNNSDKLFISKANSGNSGINDSREIFQHANNVNSNIGDDMMLFNSFESKLKENETLKIQEEKVNVLKSQVISQSNTLHNFLRKNQIKFDKIFSKSTFPKTKKDENKKNIPPWKLNCKYSCPLFIIYENENNSYEEEISKRIMEVNSCKKILLKLIEFNENLNDNLRITYNQEYEKTKMTQEQFFSNLEYTQGNLKDQFEIFKEENSTLQTSVKQLREMYKKDVEKSMILRKDFEKKKNKNNQIKLLLLSLKNQLRSEKILTKQLKEKLIRKKKEIIQFKKRYISIKKKTNSNTAKFTIFRDNVNDSDFQYLQTVEEINEKLKIPIPQVQLIESNFNILKNKFKMNSSCIERIKKNNEHLKIFLNSQNKKKQIFKNNDNEVKLKIEKIVLLFEELKREYDDVERDERNLKKKENNKFMSKKEQFNVSRKNYQNLKLMTTQNYKKKVNNLKEKMNKNYEKKIMLEEKLERLLRDKNQISKELKTILKTISFFSNSKPTLLNDSKFGGVKYLVKKLERIKKEINEYKNLNDRLSQKISKFKNFSKSEKQRLHNSLILKGENQEKQKQSELDAVTNNVELLKVKKENVLQINEELKQKIENILLRLQMN